MNVTGSIWLCKVLTSDKLQNDRFQIPVNQLPSGFYLLQIMDEKGIGVQVVRFMK